MVQRMKTKSCLIVLHDTEHEEMSFCPVGYRYRYNLKAIRPQISVGSQTDDLKWLADLYKVYGD